LVNPSLSLFTPIQLLGKGSFGEVYLVKQKQKLYALKIISKKIVMSQNIYKYIHTEKNVQSTLSYPFIVKLYCAFQSKNYLFMVMDYCPGGDLGKVLQRELRFTVERARVYLAEILLALEELHRQEIIYRDLKPENVVLDREGHVLLTDFGLSKQGIKCNDFTDSFCGSVAYLAPEMPHIHHTVDDYEDRTRPFS
jgi:serine/threonine protein kinase